MSAVLVSREVTRILPGDVPVTLVQDVSLWGTSLDGAPLPEEAPPVDRCRSCTTR